MARTSVIAELFLVGSLAVDDDDACKCSSRGIEYRGIQTLRLLPHFGSRSGPKLHTANMGRVKVACEGHAARFWLFFSPEQTVADLEVQAKQSLELELSTSVKFLLDGEWSGVCVPLASF